MRLKHFYRRTMVTDNINTLFFYNMVLLPQRVASMFPDASLLFLLLLLPHLLLLPLLLILSPPKRSTARIPAIP